MKRIDDVFVDRNTTKPQPAIDTNDPFTNQPKEPDTGIAMNISKDWPMLSDDCVYLPEIDYNIDKANNLNSFWSNTCSESNYW